MCGFNDSSCMCLTGGRSSCFPNLLREKTVTRTSQELCHNVGFEDECPPPCHKRLKVETFAMAGPVLSLRQRSAETPGLVDLPVLQDCV